MNGYAVYASDYLLFSSYDYTQASLSESDTLLDKILVHAHLSQYALSLSTVWIYRRVESLDLIKRAGLVINLVILDIDELI